MSTTTLSDQKMQKPVENRRVTLRFAGDSGDGMRLVGGQFTSASAIFGNDVSTLPDYPAEIRAGWNARGSGGFQITSAVMISTRQVIRLMGYSP